MNTTADAITTESQALLLDLARRCEELAAVLPELHLPEAQVLALAGELQRLGVRLALVEDLVVELGPAC